MTHKANEKSTTSLAYDHTPTRSEPVVFASPDKHEAGPLKAGMAGRTRGKKFKGKAMKIIRRIHLYTGLMLLPWVLLFGASGFMFNHMNLFQSELPATTAYITAETNMQTMGFGIVDPGQLAQTIVASLNEQTESEQDSYELVNATDAHLRGVITFEANSPQGQKHKFVMSLRTGKSQITTTHEADEKEPPRSVPAFAGKRVPVDGLAVNDLPSRVEMTSKLAGVEADGQWRTGRNGPELRFELRDQDQRVWHVTYDIMSSQLAGRAKDEPVTTNIATIMTSLHKQHGYPAESSMQTVWLIIGDITALTMVFWGVSGVIMWWQLKPTRALGLTGLLVMALVAFVVFWGALDEMYYGPPNAKGKSQVHSKATGPLITQSMSQ